MTGAGPERRSSAAEAAPVTFTSDVAVVYLVRFAEGRKPVATFITSYLRHPAGLAHDFVVIKKGFRPGRTKLDKILDPLHPHAIAVSDDGFDISAYAYAAAHLPHRHVVFLNTFSEIVSDHWLQKLHTALQDPTIGAAGATGSYESLRSSMKRFNKGWWLFENRISPAPTGLRSAMRFVRKLLPRRLGNDIATKVISYFVASAKKPNYDRSLDDRFESFWEQGIRPGGAFEYLSAMPAFPNPHIRSNAFMIERSLFLDMVPRKIQDKKASYLFESGPDGLTQQILRRGQKVVVVGADGARYDMDQWVNSGTFRQGDQYNLLIRDNQTRSFDSMSRSDKAALAAMTWGE